MEKRDKFGTSRSSSAPSKRGAPLPTIRLGYTLQTACINLVCITVQSSKFSSACVTYCNIQGNCYKCLTPIHKFVLPTLLSLIPWKTSYNLFWSCRLIKNKGDWMVYTLSHKRVQIHRKSLIRFDTWHTGIHLQIDRVLLFGDQNLITLQFNYIIYLR